MSPSTFGQTHYHAAGGDVHHSRADCPVGSEIPVAKRQRGSGGLPRCPECRRLDEAAGRAAPEAGRTFGKGER